jgi:hypothetical protein
VGGELLAAGSGWPSGPGRGEWAMASCVGSGEGAVRCWAAERAAGGAGPAQRGQVVFPFFLLFFYSFLFRYSCIFIPI